MSIYPADIFSAIVLFRSYHVSYFGCRFNVNFLGADRKFHWHLLELPARLRPGTCRRRDGGAHRPGDNHDPYVIHTHVRICPASVGLYGPL